MGGNGRIRIALTLTASMTVPAFGAEADNARMRDRSLRRRVAQAVGGAAERLRRPECAGLLSEFRDGSGHSLQDNLDALGVPASEYLERRVFFYHGFDARRCEKKRVLAVTERGSRIVRVCASFFREAGYDPRLGEAIIIHEALHTLGLGENPPSSREITARVLKRCR